ncbi:uncharacterized protein LOC144343755, partial [Saccoglossus kowalevskii]
MVNITESTRDKEENLVVMFDSVDYDFVHVTCETDDAITNVVNITESTRGKGENLVVLLDSVDSDFVQVTCKSVTSNRVAEYTNLLAHVHPRNSFKRNFHRVPSSLSKTNVVMLGFDSTSSMSVLRLLPKSYSFLINTMKSFVLHKYNILGDGTVSAFFPWLLGKPYTGKDEICDMSDTLDNCPFIWNRFNSSGYVTMYAEDSPTINVFSHYFKGFRDQPTSHYMQPFWLKTSSVSFCIGNKPQHQILFDYLHNFQNTYKNVPHFAFTFLNKISHDSISTLQWADDDLLAYLTAVYYKGLFDNTIFILMSDHGSRFSSVRKTPQGRQEELLPFFSIFLPPKLRVEHPSRGISLFDTIPHNRSCRDAGIPPHYCSCLPWQPATKDEMESMKVLMIQVLNSGSIKYRHLCDELKLHKMHSANTSMFTKQDSDKDTHSNGIKKNRIKLYRSVIETVPGHGIYDITVPVGIDVKNIDPSYPLVGISTLHQHGRT